MGGHKNITTSMLFKQNQFLAFLSCQEHAHLLPAMQALHICATRQTCCNFLPAFAIKASDSYTEPIVLQRRPEGKSQRETTSTNKARPALKNGTFIANNKLITRDISQCRIAGIRRELATQGLLPLFEKNRRKNE